MIDNYVFDGSTCFLHMVSTDIKDTTDAVQVRAVLFRVGDTK